MGNIMTIRPPDWIKETIQNEAKHLGLTVNAVTIQILGDWAKQQAPPDGAREQAG